MSGESVRSKLVDRVLLAVAEFGAASDEVDAAAAAELQVNRTDLRILDIVLAEPELSAMAVGKAAKLSPAATTAAIQRLVAAGYLVRESSLVDRRKAVLSLTPVARRIINRVYRPLELAGRDEIKDYAESELALIDDFLVRSTKVQYDHAARIRAMRAESGARAADRKK